MDLTAIASLIQNVGFNAVVCLAAFWYIKYREDANDTIQKEIRESYQEEITSLRNDHREETKALTDAITNNTMIVTQLYDYLKTK